MDQQIRFCTTSDGVRIAYAVTGSGPPLVWVPGWVSHAEIDWDWPVLGERYHDLTKSFTLLRIDKRGTGLSTRGLPKYSRELFVKDVEAVVDHAGLDRFALAGYSEGGPVALDYAAHHPDRVSHLILMGSGLLNPDEHPEMAEFVRAMVTIVRKSWGSAVKMLSDVFLGEDAPADAQQRFAAYQRDSANPHDAAEMLAAVIGSFNVADLAAAIKTPTLVIHARSDAAVPIEFGQRLAEAIPGASFKSIEGQHVPNREQSAVMTAAIGDFILGERPAAVVESEPADAAPLTILFTDMESSTALTQRLGDAKAQELVRVHNAVVREALAASHGNEIKHTGDGIMASFQSASRALECAVAIQRGLADRDGDTPVRVRVGLNAGEPVAEDDDLFGTSVQLASRICDRAEPGQIVVADVVRQLAAGKGFLFADMGEVIPKGFEEPVRLFQVRWQEDET